MNRLPARAVVDATVSAAGPFPSHRHQGADSLYKITKQKPPSRHRSRGGECRIGRIRPLDWRIPSTFVLKVKANATFLTNPSTGKQQDQR